MPSNLVQQGWKARLRRRSPTALAQACRPLRAVLNVAVADEAIAFNPYRLRGAGTLTHEIAPRSTSGGSGDVGRPGVAEGASDGLR